MFRTLVRERLTAQDGAQQPATLFDVGRPTVGEQDSNKGVNHTLIGGRGSESADYLTARIARDRPDILERTQAVAYKSGGRWPNAAPPMRRRALYFSK